MPPPRHRGRTPFPLSKAPLFLPDTNPILLTFDEQGGLVLIEAGALTSREPADALAHSEGRSLTRSEGGTVTYRERP